MWVTMSEIFYVAKEKDYYIVWKMVHDLLGESVRMEGKDKLEEWFNSLQCVGVN